MSQGKASRPGSQQVSPTTPKPAEETGAPQRSSTLPRGYYEYYGWSVPEPGQDPAPSHQGWRPPPGQLEYHGIQSKKSAETSPADPVQLKSEAPAASTASSLDPTLRQRAEASLGVDLGGVQVHQGPDATAANRHLGAQAFTHGQNIVLGERVDNTSNPVMAHEVVHTVQQRGAAPGVAPKLERGAAHSAHETEADAVAGRIQAGLPARVSQTGVARMEIMCFEGAEHMNIGNQAWHDRQVTVGKVTLPAGAFTALQGDFFGTWEEMERACNDNPKLMYDYYQVLVREDKLRKAHEKGLGPEPDSNGAILVALGLNGRTPKNYLDLAANNFNHFSEQNAFGQALFDKAMSKNPAYAAEIADAKAKFGHNIGQWLDMHMMAVTRSFKEGLNGKELGRPGEPTDRSHHR